MGGRLILASGHQTGAIAASGKQTAPIRNLRPYQFQPQLRETVLCSRPRGANATCTSRGKPVRPGFAGVRCARLPAFKLFRAPSILGEGYLRREKQVKMLAKARRLYRFLARIVLSQFSGRRKRR
jgi:hypothetical protein